MQRPVRISLPPLQDTRGRGHKSTAAEWMRRYMQDLPVAGLRQQPMDLAPVMPFPKKKMVQGEWAEDDTPERPVAGR